MDKKAQVKQKAVANMESLLRSAIIKRFKEAVSEIKKVIIDQYDEDLVDVVTDRESKTNPNFYRDDFIKRLDSFIFVDERASEPAIMIPDMESFDFSGRLRVIEMILEGTAGLYVEVDGNQYKAIFKHPPTTQDPLDTYVPPAERVYLVRQSTMVKSTEKANKKPFVIFPFSNTPPIKILEPAQQFAEENAPIWVAEAIAVATKTFANNFKGAKL